MKNKLLNALVIALIMLQAVAPIGALADGGPTITSELPEYAPTETVNLYGAGWQAQEAVHVFVNDNVGQTWSYTTDVVAADDGTFAVSFQLPDWFVATYFVTATGASGATASTTFADGNATVTGVVKDSSNNPISGATVTCDNSSGCNASFSTTTNVSGQYFFDGQAGHGAKLTFAGNGPTSLTLTASKIGYTSDVETVTNVSNGNIKTQNFTLTVNIQNQTITVTQPAPATAAYGSSFTVAATGGGSGNPVVIASSGACSGSGNNSTTITVTSGTGTCTVTYNQAGSSGYNAAPQVSSNTTAQKAVATVTVNGYTGNYDGAAHGASGSATGVGGVDLSAQLSLGATFTDVPGGTAHWAFSGGTNYTDQSGDVAILINKAPAGCTVSGYTGAYDGGQHGATGSCTGTGTLDLGAKFTDAPGGTAHWTFTAGNGNYSNDAGDVAITISKADAVCAVNGFTGTYDGAAHSATGTCTGVGGADLSSSLSLGVSFTDAPGGTAHWTFAGGTNYNDQSGDVAITINKAAATCSIGGYSGVYDAAAHGASGTCTGVGGVTLGGLDLGASFTNAPGGTAHWAFSGGTNYNDQAGDVSIDITKADATCTISGYSDVYDTAAHGATGSCSGIGGESAGTLDLGATFTNVPGGTAHWVFTGNGNYNDQSGNVSIDISKADATCSVNGYSDVYDAASHGATGSCSGIGGESAGALNLGASFKDVPGGTAHWVFTGNGNYNDKSGDAAITITKADAICSINGYGPLPYDATSHGATGSCSGVDAGGAAAGSGLSLGDSFKDYPGGNAHWTFAGGTNYNNQEGDVNIAISKADADCSSITGYNGVYTATPHGASGSCKGVDAGDAALGSSLDLGSTFTNVAGGTAHWAFTGGTNYNDQEGDVSIDISKANATCSINGYTGTYDAASHGATGSCSGIGGEDAGTLNLGATFKNVPGGTAHWSFTGNGNYNDQSGDAAITINKADATCSVNGYNGVYDAAAHGATGSCSGIGGENAGSLNLGASFTNVPGGTAHWVFTGNGNYKDQSSDAAITITKADATCSISGYTGVYDGAAHGASGSCSGIGGENAGTLNLGATFTAVPGGTAHWVFTGNGNYEDQSGDVAIVINAWKLLGFYQPVDMNGVLNTVKGGSTVPLKFNVYAGTQGQNEQTNTNVIKSFTTTVVACKDFSSLLQDPINVTATGGTSLRYDITGHQFIQNWQTPKQAGVCYKVTMTTIDLSTIIAYFMTK